MQFALNFILSFSHNLDQLMANSQLKIKSNTREFFKCEIPPACIKCKLSLLHFSLPNILIFILALTGSLLLLVFSYLCLLFLFLSRITFFTMLFGNTWRAMLDLKHDSSILLFRMTQNSLFSDVFKTNFIDVKDFQILAHQESFRSSSKRATKMTQNVSRLRNDLKESIFLI